VDQPVGFPLACINSLAATKALNCGTTAARRFWLLPPASNIINTTPVVFKRLRRVDGRLRVRRREDAGISRDQEAFCISQ